MELEYDPHDSDFGVSQETWTKVSKCLGMSEEKAVSLAMAALAKLVMEQPFERVPCESLTPISPEVRQQLSELFFQKPVKNPVRQA